MTRKTLATAAALAAATAITTPVAFGHSTSEHHNTAATSRGPSTVTNPYVVPVAGGVHIRSLLTVDDAGKASNGYEMAGIPDGLGALPSHGRTFDLFMNQELSQGRGVVRAHGQRGAFVSHLTIDNRSGEVVRGEDLIKRVSYYDYASGEYASTAPAGENAEFARFCSGTLAQPGAFYDHRSGRGYAGGVYFGNEESGDNGRDFGVTLDGTAQQLPRLGRHAYENTKPAADTGARTVVISTDDSSAAQLFVYAGAKRNSGNAFDRAGLTNGALSVIRVAEKSQKLGGKRAMTDAEYRAAYGKNKAVPVDLSQINWDQSSGAAQNAEAAAKGLSLNRIEDASWDPSNPNDFYFITTEGGDTKRSDPNVPRDGGGLWRLSLEDREHPELGGTLTLLLDGSEAPYLNKPDNVEIDRNGNVLIQEDPGGNPHVARVIAYEIKTGARGVLAQFDPAQFAPKTPGGSDATFTTDEESSGIIDASRQLGPNWYLFDAQVHKPNANEEYVEYGQLLAMHVANFRDVYRQR